MFRTAWDILPDDRWHTFRRKKLIGRRWRKPEMRNTAHEWEQFTAGDWEIGVLPNRVRSKIKIKKKQMMAGLDGLDSTQMQYWRVFLKRSMDRKEDIALYCDPAVKELVEMSVRDVIRSAQDGIYVKARSIFDIENGKMAGGAWRKLWPTMSTPIDINLYALSDRVEWNRNYWEQQRAVQRELNVGWRGVSQEELAKRQIWQWHQVGGAFSIDITHQGGRTKVWVSPSVFPPDFKEPWDTEARGRPWNRTVGAFNRFISLCDDDDLRQLWLEFPSSREIRTELVRRAGNFFPTDVTPFSFAKLLQIRNAEFRRAIVGFCDINWPEPFAKDDQGELIMLDQWVNILRVTCPSTGRVFHLGVPANEGLNTPTEARMWTLRLNPEITLDNPKLIAEA